jgi:Ni/Fe-hydrogenase 1 B-type cytochrome subunit
MATRASEIAPAPAGSSAATDTPSAAETSRIIDSFVPAASQRVRLYVWQVPVRITHWVVVGSVAVLTVTGSYIADPFLIPPGGSIMMTARFVHMLAAFTFVAAGIARTYWLIAGNRFARWTAFFPTSRKQAKELFHQLGWYLLVRRDAPRILGHNQLAAATYLIVFFLFGIQTVTGFALVGMHGIQPWATLFGWVPDVMFGVQGVRLIHHLLMWAILGFVVHHVYSALLVDHVERNGLMSSIFTGFKFVTRKEVIEARDGGIDLEENLK